MRVPVRLGAAENTLIAQLQAADAGGEAERLSVAGLPTRRVEAYHYTDLKMLLRAVPALAVVDSSDEMLAALDLPNAFRVGIANGHVAPHAAAPAGVIVGKAEGSALTERDDILVRLNSALAPETLTLTLSGKIEPVVHIDRRTTGTAAHSPSSARIFVADGAHAVVVESYSGTDAAHVTNDASFVQLGRGATLTHITVDLSAKEATHFATHEYELAEEAQLRTLVIHAGAGLERTQVFTRFGGEGAHADITGLNLTNDTQHADITLEVRHAKGHCTCKPMFKQIARGRSKVVFQGKIVVERDAQKTDAKLMMQGLMLSDEAEILSKPELEIFADDVVCGHGSTCGKLDEDSLFYLVSRGIAPAEAETMLVRGFIAELLDAVENEELNAALQGVVDGWLGRK